MPPSDKSGRLAMFHPTISIRRIAFAIVALTVLLVALIGGILIWKIHKQMLHAADEAALNYAHIVAISYDQWLNDSVSVMNVVANIVGRHENKKDCQALLRLVTRNYHERDTLMIAGADGNIWCGSNPSQDIAKAPNLITRSYFQQAVSSHHLTRGPVVSSFVDAHLLVPMALPVLNTEGDVEFVVLAGKALTWFDVMVESLKMPDGTHIALLNEKGENLAHWPPLSHFVSEEMPEPLRNGLIKALANHERAIFNAISHDGVERLHAVVPIGDSEPPLGILVSEPSSQVLAAINRFMAMALGLLVLTLACLGGALIAVLNTFIARPLALLAEGTRAISAGNLAWRGERQRGCAEVTALTESFNSMAGALAAQESRIQAQASELARSNQELQNFAYTVSHDLREPMRTVGAFAQLLERRCRSEISPEGREFLGYITEGAAQMSRMLDGILEFSRIHTRARPMSPVALDQVLDQARHALALAIEESQAVLHLNALPMVQGDAEQLARLFQNLLANAIKFHRPEVPPQITVTPEIADPGWVRIAVADNGIGIPIEGRETLFSLFRRLVPHGSIPGDGIGLALCKRIAEHHGGRIEVQSTPGDGATFLVTLPVAQSDDPQDAQGQNR